MPEQLTKQEVDSKTDPSVSKQWDTTTPKSQQISELYEIIDKEKICMVRTSFHSDFTASLFRCASKTS
jgi:hypothetical protein